MRILPAINYKISPIHYQPIAKSDNRAVQTQPAHNNVSFCGPSTIADAYMGQLIKPHNINRLKRLSTTYLDIIESVAATLKAHGTDFDRAYCEKSPIKSPEACISKVARSGNLKMPDQIRATLLCKNAYDLSILNEHIIPAFAERGFVLAPIDVPIDEIVEKGYIPTKAELKKGTVKRKDLDIRLDKEQITHIPAEYSNYISQAESSGYEDIQMRFVRDYDKKDSPVLHELIIIFGKEYSKAKYYESEKIYKYTRTLKELHFLNETKNENKKTITKRYIALIKSILSSGISKKLFESAKNLDIYNIDNSMLINVSEQDILEIKKFISHIRAEARDYYDFAEKRAKSPKRIKMLKKQRDEDANLLTQFQNKIMESIDFFNNVQYFNKLPETY